METKPGLNDRSISTVVEAVAAARYRTHNSDNDDASSTLQYFVHLPPAGDNQIQPIPLESHILSNRLACGARVQTMYCGNQQPCSPPWRSRKHMYATLVTWILKILSTLRPSMGFSNFCRNWSLRDEYEWCLVVRTDSLKSSDRPPRKVLST